MVEVAAASQYRARLAELRDELEEAGSANDLDRTARLRQEMELLIGELATAGRRGWRAASHAERARSAVAKRIHSALRRISDVEPIVGRQLQACVRTGFFCSYTPDPCLRIECERPVVGPSPPWLCRPRGHLDIP